MRIAGGVVVGFAAATAALAISCSDILGPLPDRAIPMEPLPVYAEWWRLTEQCSGLTGDFSSIQWYVVPGARSFQNGATNVQGLWSTRRIVVAGLSQRDGRLVRHEMLHALLNRAGHPRAAFVGRCGLLVSCDLDCPGQQSAPPEAPGAVSVSESQLVVTADVWPAAPSTGQLDGYFRLRITVHNPQNKPVVVREPPTGEEGRPFAFRYAYVRDSAGVALEEPARFAEMTRFGPGEMKVKVFDFWIAPSEGQPLSGSYSFRGGYGEHWGAPASVTITP